jgi:hypothetical protein
MRRNWIELLRASGEGFAREVNAALLANLSGREVNLPLPELFRRYGELSSLETFERLSESVGDADDRSLALLTELVGTNLERHATAEVRAKLLAREASTSVNVDGQDLGYRSLPLEIRESADPERRAALERALIDQRLELAPLAAESLSRAREAAARAGGEDYVRWRSRLGRFDIDALALEAEALLEATDDMAHEALSWLLKGCGSPQGADDVSTGDLWFAQRARELDRLLPRGELWRVDDFLGRWGLAPEAGGRIIRDQEPRPGKSARAFCVPLAVPKEIHLVLSLSGGLPHWRALLHELGHALHLSQIAPELPFERRRLGDASVTEGYAVLLDHLLLNPNWARSVLRLPPHDADALVRKAAASALLITRRHTAKVLVERALHRDHPEAVELHEELMRRATGVRPLPGGPEIDADPELYCTRYLRAWMFEALAHEKLRERFDEDWFINPRTSDWLRALFAEGGARDLDQITEDELGQPLSWSPIVRRFEEVLG